MIIAFSLTEVEYKKHLRLPSVGSYIITLFYININFKTTINVFAATLNLVSISILSLNKLLYSVE